jgi:hypothetical protein
MSKVVLDTVTGGYALSVINDNFQKVEDALNNQVLYRDNVTGEPNAMSDDLDMNSKRIYNLPTPALASEAARLQDVQNAVTGAKAANLVTVAPAGTLGSTNVQAALQELDGDLQAHINDTSAAHSSSAISFIAGASGATTRNLQDRDREIVSLSDFDNFDNTGVTSINACLALATAYCNSLTVTPVLLATVRPVLIIPTGIYKLTADAPLPLHVECHGQFTGAYKLTLTNVKRPRISGLSCTTLKVSGCWFGEFDDIFGNLEIDGGGVGIGTFWNTFRRMVSDVTIDLSNWSVNQNTFTGRGNFVTVGSGVNVLDGHGNNTNEWDFTANMCSNTASVQQDSMIIGSYYEAGADVVGPYHVIGFQGDAGGPPRVLRRNHILASYDVIEKNSADFIATSDNILAGGDWSDLDSTGKPPCLSLSNVPSTVINESSEPFGIGVKIGGLSTAAFANFSINVPPCSTGKFSMVVAYQGPDFAAIEVQRGGGGGTSSGGSSISWADQTNNWKLLRISGKASKTHATGVVLYTLIAAGSATTYLGGMYCTQEKAAQLPSPKYIREAHGIVTQGYVSGGTSVAIAVTFPKAFAVIPSISTSIETNGIQTPNYTKIVLESVSVSGFTARVYYAADWTGKLHWFARGVN